MRPEVVQRLLESLEEHTHLSDFDDFMSYIDAYLRRP